MKKIVVMLSATTLLGPAALAGPDWQESEYGEAGSFPGSAQVTKGSGSLSRIRGRLSTGVTAGLSDFEDMYLVRITDPAAFSAETYLEGEANFNTQLWLFDAEGFGVLGNDDAPAGGPTLGKGQVNGSLLLPAPDDGSGGPIAAGLYYLAITGYDNDPASVLGPIFHQAVRVEISGPDGAGGSQPLFQWEPLVGPEVGDYVIALNGVRFASLDLCPADLNDDGEVSVQDMVMVTLAWGTGTGPGDLNGDGLVSVSDLVELMLQWGPCPGGKNEHCPGKGDCYSPHPSPGCEDEVCCQTVCADDPFCCELEWDQICAAAALEVCGGAPACPGQGNCFVANGTPGCECEDCCLLICGSDPFCCDVEWDEICADDALAQCDCAGPCPGQGDCAVPNGTPGCNEAVCCLLVCELDAFCCDSEWDADCAALANTNCTFAQPCPGEGDCYLANGTPGCDDETCCTMVCDLDPFCCIEEWDQSCADRAVVVCSPPCDLQCEASMTLEPEPCGADVNGGCNTTPAAYGVISCQETVCGTAWSDSGSRDTDWYLLDVTGSTGCTEVTAALASEFAGQVFIVGGMDTCNPVVLGQRGSSSQCLEKVPAVAALPPGTYVIFVSTAGFDGFPCGDLNDYHLTIDCQDGQPGACDTP